MYLIKEAAQLSGVSVKTLHHYDKLGLLVPQKSENGYRIYSDEDLSRLQIILFYKYLGFSLGKIAELLSQPSENKLSHLQQQLCFLKEERQHLDSLISTLQKTIQAEKGEIYMSNQEKFVGFTDEDNALYYDQAVEAYGQKAVEQVKKKEVTQVLNQIFRSLADNLEQGLSIEDRENQKEADRLFQALNIYAFNCSLEVFGSIGQSYAADSEFKKNIDRFGAGLAQYTADIIQVYVAEQTGK